MIKFENVFFKYSNSTKNVLENINLNIKKGSWTSILGENGSGKSTLMKLLYGQHKPTNGKILVNGNEYTEEVYDEIRNGIAVVFQNPDNQFVGATVEEDIAFGLENRNIPSELMDSIIEKSLEAVDMLEYRKYEPVSLSGGQKQRVAIASALALKPKILILDESTSMLDPRARHSILEYIKRINEENEITIISITHDAEESKYSNDIVIMNNGRIVFTGDYNLLYAKPDILNMFNLETPFLERIKNDLNKHLGSEVFKITEDERSVVEKICKLI